MGFNPYLFTFRGRNKNGWGLPCRDPYFKPDNHPARVPCGRITIQPASHLILFPDDGTPLGFLISHKQRCKSTPGPKNYWRYEKLGGRPASQQPASQQPAASSQQLFLCIFRFVFDLYFRPLGLHFCFRITGRKPSNRKEPSE